MALAFSSPEDVCNGALAALGYKRRVGSLFDGSDASKKFLDIYSHVRQEKFRMFDWGFSERNLLLTLLKTAPVGGYNPANPWTTAFPPIGWAFEYAYPSDMIKIRSLRSSTAPVPNFDPKPAEYRVLNDTVTGTVPAQQKVIVCNVPNALVVYSADVTDPTLWEADFAEAMVTGLATRLGPGLAGLDVTKLEATEEAVTTQQAEARLG